MVKRTNVQYNRPRSPEPVSNPAEIALDGALDFNFSSFTSCPSAEEIEQYLDEEDDDDERGGPGRGDGKGGEKTFATLVSKFPSCEI